MTKKKKGPESIWVGDYLKKLEDMLLAGKSLQECGDVFNVSRARISQVRRARLPHLAERTKYGRGLAVRQAVDAHILEMRKRFNRDTFRPSSELEAAWSKAYIRKRQNTKRDGGKWEFTVAMSDIEWPTHCPILGLELDWFAEKTQENSPSFDRVDPSEGYVPGNVVIMSWRANRIKNDGNAAEHRAIADWLDGLD